MLPQGQPEPSRSLSFLDTKNNYFFPPTETFNSAHLPTVGRMIPEVPSVHTLYMYNSFTLNGGGPNQTILFEKE